MNIWTLSKYLCIHIHLLMIAYMKRQQEFLSRFSLPWLVFETSNDRPLLSFAKESILLWHCRGFYVQWARTDQSLKKINKIANFLFFTTLHFRLKNSFFLFVFLTSYRPLFQINFRFKNRLKNNKTPFLLSHFLLKAKASFLESIESIWMAVIFK